MDTDGDGWQDGPEVAYWDNPNNGQLLDQDANIALKDPDRTVDTDGDGLPNIQDMDSDDDGLTDGQESSLQSYPELPDSDCAVVALSCTPPGSSNHHDQERQGKPGTGDGIGDAEESFYWGIHGGVDQDFDGDGIESNLLDPDSDGDGLLDGEEIVTGQVLPYMVDTDGDGVPDGEEVAWNQDSDGDGLLNANDIDSDDDGMPDGYERDHRFNPIDPLDAARDADADALTNLEEYLAATNPHDADTEDDLLLDGQEVKIHGTDPHAWDTDGDDIPDYYEVHNDLDPLSAVDRDIDPDGDSFDEDRDGTPEQPWGNLDEYAYGRPTWWQEASRGPWLGGTLANDPDSDGDGASDGWEAYHDQPATVPNPSDQDADGDGLGFEAEWDLLTDPRAPDTDLDGLCDGGGGPQCFRDGRARAPGEVLDYGTDPRSTDTDGDGLSDEQEARRWDPSGLGIAPDTDGDGLNNLQDPDSDDDTLTDWDEVTYVEASDPASNDTDSDGLTDAAERLGWTVRVGEFEYTQTSHPAVSDSDADGLSDGQESVLRLDPRIADTDGDGLCDGGRAAACTFPTASGGFHPGEKDYGSLPSVEDSDGDGLDDGAEAARVDPSATGVAPDSDGDGVHAILDADSDNDELLDGQEIGIGTDPDVSDTDADLLDDGEEILHFGTSPLNGDTDADGLGDGMEVGVYGTKPLVADTDGDMLEDGAEVNQFGTDPTLWDTDQDELPDGWEVALGTQPLAPDADADPDLDGLTNAEEYALFTHPQLADTDVDGMTDGYEVTWGLDPTLDDAAGDLDADGLVNLAERNKGTMPNVTDTDADGLYDGAEVHQWMTDPRAPDSDDDGIVDGAEVQEWSALGAFAWRTDYDGDGSPSNLVDADTDGDGLDDGEEFQDTNTKPHDADTDGDGLTDWEEVVQYQGQYDPNDDDTDDDGVGDEMEVALTDNDGDRDQDGVPNGAEVETYGTDPTRPDTDCDGAQDGPELNYWGSAWLVDGTNRLLTPDVDGDTIADGVEMGLVGTPRDVVYHTRPDLADTDGDGLSDGDEDHNQLEASCGTQQASNDQSAGWDKPLPGPSFPFIVNSPEARALLQTDVLYEDPVGALYALDGDQGPYLVGGYGVALVPVTDGDAPWQWPALDLESRLASPTSGHHQGSGSTSPVLPDTDGDGVGDGDELLVHHTDPLDCDTDDDFLGDGAELGVYGWTTSVNDPCTHRDRQPSTGTNPLVRDTDGDGRLDGIEDANRNGLADGVSTITSRPYFYCGGGGESDATDLDSDDDGLSDFEEIALGLRVLCFDSDRDGLSDGLEEGVTSPVMGGGEFKGTDTSKKVNVAGILTWPTWQPYRGTGMTTHSDVRDSDGDGLIDGLEDLDHDGRFGMGDFGSGDGSSLLGRMETSPRDKDSDSDGLADGRELLVHGTYTFWEAVANLGGANFPQLRHDPINPWQTAPTVPDTDGDGYVDGLDLNPRADAFVAFVPTAYQCLEQADPWPYNDLVELYVSRLHVELPLGVGAFDFSMQGSEAIPYPGGTNEWRYDLGELMEYVVNEARDGLPSGIPSDERGSEMLGTQANAVRFNIPDDAMRPTSMENLRIVVQIDLMDEDGGNPDDTLDLNPDSTRETLEHVFHLAQDPRGQYDPAETDQALKYLSWVGGAQQHKGDLVEGGRVKDAWIRASGGDNVPTYFLDGIKQVRSWKGTADPLDKLCFGATVCVI